MTDKECIEAIKSNYPPANYSMLREALDRSMELLEKADEYRWHRELNSFDLPKEDEEVFVHMHYKSTDSYVYGMACEFDWSEDGGIVAWKYPELDDGVEE